MITDLTQEQKDVMPAYADRWLKNGLQSGKDLPSDEDLLALFSAIYKVADLPPPTKIVRANGPTSGVKIAADLMGVSARDALSQAIYGCQDSGWLSFYNYIYEQLPSVEGPQRLVPLMNLAKAAVGWCWPLEETVVVTPVPKELHIRKGRIHKDLGPAISYEDGTEVYALNGVVFRDEDVVWVKTPANQLDKKKVLGIKNVEQRAEVIKKIGVGALFKDLSPILLDKETVNGHKYELYEVSIGYPQPRIYLKMNNPSIDEIHIEGVHPDCKTVVQALQYRKVGEITGKFVPPVVLT